MKKKEERSNKLMTEIMTENKKLAEPLAQARTEVWSHFLFSLFSPQASSLALTCLFVALELVLLCYFLFVNHKGG